MRLPLGEGRLSKYPSATFVTCRLRPLAIISHHQQPSATALSTTECHDVLRQGGL